MRVVLFVNGFPNPKNPVNGIFNQRAALALAEEIDLRIIVPRAWVPGRKLRETSNWNGIPLLTITAPQIPRFDILNLRLYQYFVRETLASYFRQADIIHSVGVDFAGLICGAVVTETGVKHVTQMIADLRNLNRNFESYPFLGQLQKNLAGILCNSKALEKTARTFFPATSIVRTAYRGVDVQTFSPDGNADGPLAENSADPAVRFLYLGGLPPYPDRHFQANTKGGITLMAAWQEAEKSPRFRNARLLFAGPEAESKISLEWRENLLRPESVYIQGSIAPTEVPAYLRSADVVVIPSLEEGCPNLAFEALACGKPIFGSSIEPLREIVREGETGRLVTPGDAAALKELFVEFCQPESAPILKKMGEAGRKVAVELLDHRDYIKKILQLYEDVL